MKELYFKAELLDDIVLSQRQATTGDHKSLDYIPGSAFLGAMAGRFYSKFGSDKAWDIFNSSKVCFCNAYPMINDKRSVPMPLSFHSEKVATKEPENIVLNFVTGKGCEGVQYRQNRTGYVDFAENKLNTYSVNKTSRMRTAIDAKTGSAAKSQLYGYESINAGQVFIGKIMWDDAFDSSEELKEIISIFDKGETLHIGRSKTASFGRVRVSKVAVTELAQENPEGKSFSVMAVSDLCLRNPFTGKAELQLMPEQLGLSSDWKIDVSRTFTRPNTIFQYNAFRRELETQKTLITKGSVFTFKSEKPLTSDAIKTLSEKLVTGIGTSRGQGYGEISLLNAKEKYKKQPYSQEEKKDIKLSDGEKEWLSWLSSYAESEDVEYLVKPAVAEFKELCIHIKTYQKFSKDFVFWPAKTQWNRIREVLTNKTDKRSINSALFEGENPVIKEVKTEKTELHGDTKVKNADPEWNYEDSKGVTLRIWLFNFIESKLNDSNVQNALLELSKRCQELVEKNNWLMEAKNESSGR